MNGVVLIDKPKGLTSHDVVVRIRRCLGMARVGHAGTLDPDATGLLVLTIGKATKLTQYLSGCDKSYHVRFVLGRETDTYDSSGQVVAEHDVHVTKEQLEDVLRKFLGTQEQKPPIYSARKIKGRKLYEYARAGEAVDVPTKIVTIHELRLLSFCSPEAEMEMVCSKGTYVRSLVHDIGQQLSVGGMTTEIRRMWSGDMHVRDALSLEQVLVSKEPQQMIEEALVPMEKFITSTMQCGG